VFFEQVAFENCTSGPGFGANFYTVKFTYALILKKMGWAAFWSIFSQTQITLIIF
jgi:hypothetical protein